jgi:DHA2 family multidrug resistance protein
MSGGTKAAASPFLITCSIMLATIMQALDTTIANVALPHMQGSLSATQDQVAWVLTSYIVAAAIMTPPTGFLSAKLGRKRLFVWSVVGFTIASMLCGIAATLEQMVLFRLLQGVFGAALVPLSQSVLLDTYPREKHGAAMAMWGVGVMVGPILGPTLGGYLTEYYNWRWVFFINLPFGILALMGILAFVPETEKEKDKPIDFFGFALLSLAIGALQMMLDRGELLDWFSSNEIIVETVLAGLAFYMFIVHMLTHEHPFITPRLFRDRNLVTGLCFIFLVGIVLLATMALLPPFLQNLKGYPVITVGFVLAPRGVGTMIAMVLVGRMVGKVDTRLLILGGLLATAYSLYQMVGFNLNTDQYTIVESGIIQGLGLGFIFVPLSTITFSTLDPKLRTEAAGLFSLLRNIGSSIGISVMIANLTSTTTYMHARLSESVTPFNEALKMPDVAGILDLTTERGLALLDQIVTQQATIIAFSNDFKLLMWLIIVSIPLVLIIGSGRGPLRMAREAAE